MSDYVELIRRIEGGDGADRALDGAIWCAMCGYSFDRWDGAGVVYTNEKAPSWDGGRKHEAADRVPRYTTSLDRVISLVETMLPKPMWRVERSPNSYACIWQNYESCEACEGLHESSFIRALLIALLRALSTRPDANTQER